MTVTASMVKELRERSGVGMMECKKALVEANGDMETAMKMLRERGQAKVDKKSRRVAAEGVVAVEISDDKQFAFIVEINSETDFVARDENFQKFTQQVLQQGVADKIKDIDQLLKTNVSSGETVDAARLNLITKIAEKIAVRRCYGHQSDNHFASYIHGGRIAVVVEFKGGDEALGKDIAMHIAATQPQVVSPEDVSQDVIAAEKEIFMKQAQESGKPQDIIEKMVVGRLNKFIDEISLLRQAFVKDPDQKVADLLKKNQAQVIAFTCYVLGEGIEKNEENFAEEVMAQARGSE